MYTQTDTAVRVRQASHDNEKDQKWERGRIVPLFFFYGNELLVSNVARAAGGSFTRWKALVWCWWCYQLFGYKYCTVAVLPGCCCGGKYGKEKVKETRRSREKSCNRETGTEGLRGCQKRFVGAPTFVKRDFLFPPHSFFYLRLALLLFPSFLSRSQLHKKLKQNGEALSPAAKAPNFRWYLFIPFIRPCSILLCAVLITVLYCPCIEA